ncbi:hypothetical protein STRAU_0641 [Streptomyces aurantiacus JA 4570]|uniref:Uncharacterized protein n=1 Tax=Streptomyces aurantiacus JA 4570 TaxID=1286094 RepID=S3ZSH7_9ACTN|nr:hypothetical protein STRAU_0641 [Streptomyces aurantiacus JA 4570]
MPAAVLAGARAAIGRLPAVRGLRGRAAAALRGRVAVRRATALGARVPSLVRSLSGSLLCAVVPAAASAPESSHGIERTWSGGVRSSVLWRRAGLRLTCDNP